MLNWLRAGKSLLKSVVNRRHLMEPILFDFHFYKHVTPTEFKKVMTITP